MPIYRRLILFLSFIFLSVLAQGEDFRHLGVRDGLTGGEVTCMLRDSDGFMWIGTDEGLNCFDGREAKPFLRGISVRCLEQDSKGNLWVGTKGSGLFKLGLSDGVNVAFRSIPGDDSSLNYDDIAGIVEDSGGNIWIAVDRGSLDRLCPSSGTFDHFPLADSDGHAINIALTGAALGQDGLLFLSSWGGGLYVFNPTEHSFRIITSRSEEEFCHHIFNIKVDIEGSIWVSTAHGGLKYRKFGSAEWRTFNIASKAVTVSGNNTVCIQTPNSVAFLGENPPRKGLDIIASSVYYDFEGTLWLGYSTGVSYTNTLFNNFEHRLEGHGRVMSLLSARDGTVWIGGANTVSLYDRSWKPVKEFYPQNLAKPDRDRFIQSIVQISDGSVWIGAYSNILLEYSSEGDLLSVHKIDGNVADGADGFHNIRSIYESDDSSLILCSETGALRYNASSRIGEVIFHSGDIIYPLHKARCAAEGRDGALWIGTEGGLRRFDAEDETLYLEGQYINSLLCDRNGVLWVGAKTGLFRFTGTSFEPVFDIPVRKLLEDGTGSLWVCGSSSIIRFDKKDSEGRYVVYDGADGLGAMARNCFCLSAAGALICGGEDGLNILDPATVGRKTRQNKVFLTGVRVLNKDLFPEDYPIRTCREINLKHNQSSIALSFIAPDIIGQSRVRYRYRLNGFENRWVEPVGNIPVAAYTMLKPGKYIFSVEAVDSEGKWSGPGTDIAITISPPFWITPLAYICYAAILIAISWFIVSYFSFKIKLSRLMEERQRIREASLALDENREDGFIKALKSYILDNISESGLSVGTIAEGLDMSEDQLARKVKALTGTTPYAMVVALRMQKAISLMETADMNISEIAYTLGYSELSQFSRAFKKYYSVSPRDYQGLLRKNDK